MKHVNTQGIKPSNTTSNHIRFDKLVAEDSFSENITISGLEKFP